MGREELAMEEDGVIKNTMDAARGIDREGAQYGRLVDTGLFERSSGSET